jgi:hypothetical protein
MLLKFIASLLPPQGNQILQESIQLHQLVPLWPLINLRLQCQQYQLVVVQELEEVISKQVESQLLCMLLQTLRMRRRAG